MYLHNTYKEVCAFSEIKVRLMEYVPIDFKFLELCLGFRRIQENEKFCYSLTGSCIVVGHLENVCLFPGTRQQYHPAQGDLSDDGYRL